MPKHTSETVVWVADADRIAETLCGSLRHCALSIDTNRADRVLNFGDGRAIVKPKVCGLCLRVEAEDLATFLGIRSLLQVALSRASNDQSGHLEWHPAVDELTDVISRRAGRTGRC
ncbi:SMa0974 family conjugal transfer regulator [Rhizobium sp. BR 315]|uniref:SMa0974 family conjugal transfer regulator n=1 Tax=Rhizobium sp. BR 315 TaxID=3040014 RepID=UPI003D32488D